jgi:hypothetical protein
MTRSFLPPNLCPRRWLTRFAAAMLLLAPGAARADLVFNIESVSASAGSTGNTLDVTVTNTGPSAVTVGGFSFEISTPTSNINFTDATTATTLAPYIFGGNSAFGPSIAISTGQALDASDSFFPFGSGSTLGAGATVGLGHVVFNVASGTPGGPITVSFTGGGFTSLSDPDGNDIPITTLGTGTITVKSGTVPEPSTSVLLGFAMLLSLGAHRVLRRKP